jgi:ABC-2 type transport system ATP-binding protein
VILGPDVRVSSDEPSVLDIDGLTAQEVGHLAAVNGFELHELTTEKTSLEDAFMALTREKTEYRASTPAHPEANVELDRRERIAA